MKLYQEKELMRLAKRENNTKRPYLLVNPLQGKHLPVSPSQALELFQTLSQQLFLKHSEERLLLIGFAETATAVGAGIAHFYPKEIPYIHTTRETINAADYLYFSETHSHATEQKLVINHLEDFLKQVDRIVFAEDEVTTGNTILHLIQELEKAFPFKKWNYGIVSILNGMSEETLTSFKKNGISCTYLLRLSSNNYARLLSNYHFDTAHCYPLITSPIQNCCTHTIPNKLDPRVGVMTSNYIAHCQMLNHEIMNAIDWMSLMNKKILVLGAEEFMFPALYFAFDLEKKLPNSKVFFHATTRSPILPCVEEDYPVKSRHTLVSFYDQTRTTYLYNLTQYDQVFILHDAVHKNPFGLSSLLHALASHNCNHVTLIQWEV